MAPQPTRKTGIHGMKDLKKLSSRSSKISKKRTDNVYGVSDLRKLSATKTKAKEDKKTKKSNVRSLNDLVDAEMSSDDDFMHGFMQDHTIGLTDKDFGEKSDSDGDGNGDEEDGKGDEEDDGSDEDYDGSESEAEEGDSEESSDDDDTEDEVERKRKAIKRTLPSRQRALHRHEKIAERVEADNQWEADKRDEDFEKSVAPIPKGGYYDLIPVAEDEDVPSDDEVQLEKLRDGVWVDLKTKEVYESTNFLDAKTNKLAKTVRRHKKGPPKGKTTKTRKISANDLERSQDWKADDIGDETA